MTARLPACSAALIALFAATGPSGVAAYAWRSTPVAAADTLAARIAPPDGFVREPAETGSFAAFLRGLPMRPAGSPVRLYTGALKHRQDVHAAVVDIDVGNRDLQQCADAVMRLRAEWLFAAGRKSQIGFNYTDGKRRTFGGGDYPALKKYMTGVFAYAGTYSLDRELKTVSGAEPHTGDVFIKGGFPGHAVLVADVVRSKATGERRFLLLQSYMPAQEIHVLKNPAAADGSPWYASPVGYPFATPEWTFPAGSLKRWP